MNSSRHNHHFEPNEDDDDDNDDGDDDVTPTRTRIELNWKLILSLIGALVGRLGRWLAGWQTIIAAGAHCCCWVVGWSNAGRVGYVCGSGNAIIVVVV